MYEFWRACWPNFFEEVEYWMASILNVETQFSHDVVLYILDLVILNNILRKWYLEK